MLTGEPVPVAKEKDSTVAAGTVNGRGSLVIEARAVGSETMLAGIVRMVAEAQRRRAPIQAVAHPTAGWFVPLVLLPASGPFCVWILVPPPPSTGPAPPN